MKKYRKKTVVIEAAQWTGDNKEEMFAFGHYLHAGLPDCPINRIRHNWKSVEVLTVEGSDGYHQAQIGDWITKSDTNDFSVIRPSVFAATYDLIE